MESRTKNKDPKMDIMLDLNHVLTLTVVLNILIGTSSDFVKTALTKFH